MSGPALRTWPVSLLLAAFLSGCGSPPPPPPPPTVVNVTLTATAAVNAGPGGAGAPVAVRIYLLDAAANFKGANFFPLFERDAAILKDDLIKREDILLAPGQTQTLTLMPDDRPHAIGVFAAYRDWQHVAWHATVDLPAHQTSKLTVTAGAPGLEVAIAPDKTAKAASADKCVSAPTKLPSKTKTEGLFGTAFCSDNCRTSPK